MMSVRRVMIAAPAACLLLVTACGSDDETTSSSELDCEAGIQLSDNFGELAAASGAPTVEQLESVRSELDDWSASDEISDEVQTVRDSLDVFIEQLSAAPEDIDLDALETAGTSLSEAGDAIDAYLADNCG